jgi:hypothetical protein
VTTLDGKEWPDHVAELRSSVDTMTVVLGKLAKMAKRQHEMIEMLFVRIKDLEQAIVEDDPTSLAARTSGKAGPG